MIQPSDSDIGREVIYTTRRGVRRGWIVSIYKHHVYIRFSSNTSLHATACKRDNLGWADGSDYVI